MSDRLLRYTGDLLEQCGAAVERCAPLDLELLAPPAVQAALGIGEHERLHFGATPAPGVRRVGFDGSWFEGFDALLESRGKRRSVVLAGSRAPARRPEDVVERALDLPNATWRLAKVEPAMTRVMLFRFAYTAVSDDRRAGLLDVGLNLATRSTLGELLPGLRQAADDPVAQAGPPDTSAFELSPFDPKPLRALLPARVHEMLAPFLAGLRRRLERDRNRLRSYYQKLLEESVGRDARAQRTQSSGDAKALELARVREEQRRDATRSEYEAKLADLETKYALDVEIQPVQILDLVVSVQRFHLRVLRRKRSREIALDLFPVSSRLEPPPCEYRFSADRVRLACDEAVHLVSPEGLGPCEACERPYCRVCHPTTCPRCRD